MADEVATTPDTGLITSTPATEVETETTETPETQVESEITDQSDADQSTGTEDGTPEGTTDQEERRAGLREADYTRKTQEVAEIRKALAARTERLDTIVQQGETLMQVLAEEFQSEFAGVDWGKLAAEDPAEYVRKQHAASLKQQKLQTALHRLNEAKQAQSQTQQHATQERLRDEQTKLVEKLPEWRDQKRYAAESAEISEYLAQAGYEPAEVSGVTDHRAVLLARKAMLYDRLAAKTPKPTPITKAPAPVPKAPTKATGPKDPSQMTDKEFAEWRKRQIAQRR